MDHPPELGISSESKSMITDGDQATFMRDVIEASHTLPVLVDFWATWCGPCKTLTPILEKLTRAAGGRLKLVKIDIDKNRALVQQLAGFGLPLQSVPTVAAFWQGQIADLFQGALPESEVRRFIETLLKQAGSSAPSADLVAEGRLALEAQDSGRAADLFSAALNEDAERPEAWAGLARALLAQGNDAEAETILNEAPAAIAEHAEIIGAHAAIALLREGRDAAGAREGLERKIAANPADHEARYALASAMNGLGERAAAADALLEIIRRDRGWNDDAARLQLLRFFESWGFEDADTMLARRKLSTLLFR